MADKFARVTDPNYTFRGQRLGRGTIVRLTAAQLKAAGDHNPRRLEEVDEPKEGTPTFDIRPKTFAAEIQTPEAGPAPERASLKKK